MELASFYAGVSPVTNAEFDPFATSAGLQRPEFTREPRFSAPAQPAVGVSWEDAIAYCEWLGDGYRLPTEAEREWAALGGLCDSDWPWPGAMECHLAFEEIARLDRPHVPTSRCANGYGLRCTAENVHEWCHDWYGKDAYASAGPGEPGAGARKVARGGSWRHSVKFTRVTARASLNPAFRYNDFGFRVYADHDPSAKER